MRFNEPNPKKTGAQPRPPQLTGKESKPKLAKATTQFQFPSYRDS